MTRPNGEPVQSDTYRPTWRDCIAVFLANLMLRLASKSYRSALAAWLDDRRRWDELAAEFQYLDHALGEDPQP